MRIHYQDETVTLYCGDCAEVLPRLPRVQQVITSPPYNLKKKWWDSGANGMHGQLAKKFSESWYPDEVPENAYQEREKALLRAARDICDSTVCYNHKVRYAYKRAGRAFHPMEWLGEFPLWVEIIWDKGGGPAQNCRRPVVCEERIFVFGRPQVWNDIGLTTVWHLPPGPGRTRHPCAFPEELPGRLISMYTAPGDTVLDYYAGAGTTLVAAKRLGRRSIGIEINPAYCDEAVSRLAQESLFSHDVQENAESTRNSQQHGKVGSRE